MARTLFCTLIVAACCTAALAAPVGTAFNYQGRLTDEGSPVTGQYDLRFTLHDAGTGGSPVGSPVLVDDQPITNGLFAVTLDFGNAFTGEARWLQIEVRPGSSTGVYRELTPRQELLPAPYARYALSGAGGGQWSASGDNIFNTNSGNVGIGTSSPVHKLHVAGLARFDVGAGNISMSTPGGWPGLIAYSLNGHRRDVIFDDTMMRLLTSATSSAPGAANGITITEAGDVGIQTVNPQATLHIGGMAGVDGIMFPDGTLQTTAGGGSGGLALPYDGGVSSALAAFSASNTGTGRGIQGAATNNVGVYGETASASDQHPGVWGKSTGAGPGVAGTASGASLIGVMGSSSASGAGMGVYGATPSSTGRGVFGEATTTSGVNYGVYGKTHSSSGYAGYFDGRGYFSGNVGIGTTAPSANLHVAGTGRFATLAVYNAATTTTFEVLGQAYGSGCQINLKDSSSTTRIQLTAANSEMKLYDSTGLTRIRLDGANGRTTTQVLEITGGSDLSEQFNVAAPAGEAQPGMVVCIDPKRPGELIVSAKPYDRTVAGVISGAGGVKPGMLMGQKGSTADGEHPIALTGRVYCWVDASGGAVEPGDLLTTSDTPGHAMKVLDSPKAQGAILGKAMSSLEAGRKGLVLVLVTLQ